MSVRTLGEVAENYFHTLNPIAERISTDIESIRDAYEGLWHCLSNREKEQIINETVIYPEAILKYTLGSQSHEFPSLNTREITGAKFIIDEQTGLSWRDEHSAPFSWKTPSQIDLRIFGTSKIDSPTKPNGINHMSKNKFQEKNKENGKIENGITNHDVELWAHKVLSEKNGVKKNIDTPDSPNIVLGGTSSRISGLCSKLKFLPGKSCSYEVKTVISYPSTGSSPNILDKIKGSAVLKIQNTIKLVGGKTYVAAEKKSVNESETENLVQTKNTVTVTKLQKPSPKVAKPKSPPPPPPILKAKLEETDGNETGKMIVVKPSKTDKTLPLKDDMEKVALLEDNSLSSFRSTDHDNISFDKVTHDLSSELNSLSTDFTPLSGPSDNIPKSGFDFLDNW